jgi:glucans biosynthesis protein C
MNSTLSSTRRYDLDWMRVISIVVIFIFHCSRFFDLGGWHVKNPERYLSMQIWVAFLSLWIMPFIFIISAASLSYAMNKGGFGKFLKDKSLRLLIPLLIGCFTHIAVQVYYERTTQGGFTGSFFEFYPHYFDGWYAFGGNFAWMGLHLWYLLMLFLFSLLCYPLFRLIKRLQAGSVVAVPSVGESVIATSTTVSPLAVLGLFALALPIMALMIWLNPASFLGMKGFGGWPLPTYILFFIYGFIVIGSAQMQLLITRLRYLSLGLGVAGFAALVMLWMNGGDPQFGSMRYAEIYGIWGFASWGLILGFLGIGFKSFTRSTPALHYANEAVLPFYILHQTIILTIGFFVVYWPINDIAKFFLIALSAFAIIMTMYEFAVRRYDVVRFLFGMKWKVS